MPSNKKRLIRARAAKTGESYQQAARVIERARQLFSGRVKRVAELADAQELAAPGAKATQARQAVSDLLALLLADDLRKLECLAESGRDLMNGVPEPRTPLEMDRQSRNEGREPTLDRLASTRGLGEQLRQGLVLCRREDFDIEKRLRGADHPAAPARFVERIVRAVTRASGGAAVDRERRELARERFERAKIACRLRDASDVSPFPEFGADEWPGGRFIVEIVISAAGAAETDSEQADPVEIARRLREGHIDYFPEFARDERLGFWCPGGRIAIEFATSTASASEVQENVRHLSHHHRPKADGVLLLTPNRAHLDGLEADQRSAPIYSFVLNRPPVKQQHRIRFH
jgi:hypothetical protein